MDSPVLELARELLRRPSVTPEDAGCQQLLAERLSAAGFRCEHLPFGEVQNLWAEYGEGGPLLVFAGHTDVVPPGPEGEWRHPPFQPTEEDGFLYGRGAADMKGGLAAMVVAAERFAAGFAANKPANESANGRVGKPAHAAAGKPSQAGRIGFLITSDEEGPARNGTAKVVEWLKEQGKAIDWCLLGEPSSTETLGDAMKNGRRGSLSGALTVRGAQGHIAYPQLADNPVHKLAPALAALAGECWDEADSGGNGSGRTGALPASTGDEAGGGSSGDGESGDPFPPTSFQVSNIRAGTGAANVIPGEAEVLFNFRFGTAVTAAQLRKRTESILREHGLDYRLDWDLGGEPFLSPNGPLLAAAQASLREHLGTEAQLSTAGGTSDGRFIAPTGAEVLELGPINATIHKINERVRIADLETLAKIYEGILRRLLPQPV